MGLPRPPGSPHHNPSARHQPLPTDPRSNQQQQLPITDPHTSDAGMRSPSMPPIDRNRRVPVQIHQASPPSSQPITTPRQWIEGGLSKLTWRPGDAKPADHRPE